MNLNINAIEMAEGIMHATKDDDHVLELTTCMMHGWPSMRTKAKKAMA